MDIREAATVIFKDYILSDYENSAYLIQSPDEYSVVSSNSQFIELNVNLDDWKSDYIKEHAYFDSEGNFDYDDYGMLYQDSSGSIEFSPNPNSEFIKDYLIPIIK